jgi:large conductance mechanosensitive channel
VSDVLMPPIGKLMGGVNFSDLFINLDPSKTLPNGSAITSLAQAKEAGAAVIAYGQFINVTIDFVIVAFCVFMLVKGMNALKKKNAADPAAPSTQECQFCQMTISLKATRCPHCTSDLSGRAVRAVNQ